MFNYRKCGFQTTVRILDSTKRCLWFNLCLDGTITINEGLGTTTINRKVR